MGKIGTDIVRNGKAYDSGDVNVNIAGEMFPGVTKVMYGDSQEHTINHSLKNDATSWSTGKVTPGEGTLGLPMEDTIYLEKKYGDLKKVKPFWTTVTFANEDQLVITDKVFWKFTGNSRDVNGQTNLSTDHKMFIIQVKLNV